MVQKLKLIISQFNKNLKNDDVSAYSAQAAYFIMLSIFPCLMLLLTLIKYTPLKEDTLIKFVTGMIPHSFAPYATDFINQLFSQSSITLISVTAIATLWSAGKGIMAIIKGMNSVHHIDEHRNYFVLRIVSTIYTVLFLCALVLLLSIIVFGDFLYSLIGKKAPLVYEFIGVFVGQKHIISFLFLLLFFILIYKIVPDERYTITRCMPGAIFASATWIGFSYAFSIYINYFTTISKTYGSISMLMLAMLWLYSCMYLMFIGAEINVFFKIEKNDINKRIKNIKEKTRHFH